MMSIVQKIMARPSCDEVMEVLQAYLDGEVDERQAKKVAKHLDRCVDCDRESQVYARIKESLANHKRPVDPEILSALERFSKDLTT